MNPARRVKLFDCEFDALTLAETVDRVSQIIAAAVPTQHVGLNASGVVTMRDDPALRRVVNSAGLVTADGTSVVWASRILRKPLPERIGGPDLFEALITEASAHGHPVYIVGAREKALERACAELVRRNPGLIICGQQHGYFSPQESDQVVRNISESGATMLFVAMPTPQKESWIAANLERMRVPFCMGIGGAIDIVAGNISRAPLWMQKAGFEWLWRLFQEPSRMWKRYLVGNTRFFCLTCRESARNWFSGLRGEGERSNLL